MPPSATNLIIGVVFAACGVAMVVVILVVIFMLVRNSWVYRARTKILKGPDVHEALTTYDRLPSYNEMMRRFWIWRVEEFLK